METSSLESGPNSTPSPCSLTVIERARRYVARCPVAISGEGGHNATFRVAAVLVHGFALSEADALMVLQEWNRGCQPPWSEAELVHKVKSAASAQYQGPRGYLLGHGAVGRNLEVRSQVPPGCSSFLPIRGGQQGERPAAKATFCPMVLKRIAAQATGAGDVVAFVKERSPVAVDTQDSASFLRRLYPFGSGEKVLVFSEMKSQGQQVWEADRSDLIQNRHLPVGADGVWFLPQPVDGEFHPNPRQGGKPSRRSEESVTAWRFLVLESDEADPGDWLRCLIQLPLRIASICESGGRSIHALVRVDAANKADWDDKVRVIKPVLVTLGADPAALTAVRLTRLS